MDLYHRRSAFSFLCRCVCFCFFPLTQVELVTSNLELKNKKTESDLKEQFNLTLNGKNEEIQDLIGLLRFFLKRAGFLVRHYWGRIIQHARHFKLTTECELGLTEPWFPGLIKVTLLSCLSRFDLR